MIIKSLVKLNKGRNKICLDNGTDFVLYMTECKHYGIEEEGQEISPFTYDLIEKEVLIPRCRKRGLHLLEKQDRSEKNLRNKLLEGGYPQIVVDDAIEYISSFGYINDNRLAESYIHFYQGSRSKNRIKQDLLNKGISIDIIDTCLDNEYKNDETELIEALIIKKKYNKENASYEERGKMFRFLLGRGFSMDAINKCLKN